MRENRPRPNLLGSDQERLPWEDLQSGDGGADEDTVKGLKVAFTTVAAHSHQKSVL